MSSGLMIAGSFLVPATLAVNHVAKALSF